MEKRRISRKKANKLEWHSVRKNFCKDKDNKLSQLDLGANGVENDWVRLRGTAHHTTFTYLHDRNTGKHQDWFDENDEEI